MCVKKKQKASTPQKERDLDPYQKVKWFKCKSLFPHATRSLLPGYQSRTVICLPFFLKRRVKE